MERVRSKSLSVKNMAYAGMFAALLAVISQLSLPMPSGVPVTLQVFAVALTGVVLGWKMGFLSVLVYVLIGVVGMPVFANFTGGISKIVGTSGGYIVAWPFMAMLCGICPKIHHKAVDMIVNCLLALVGLMLCESVGGFWWHMVTGTGLKEIAVYSLTAFVPKDIILTVLAVVVGRKLRSLLGTVEAME